MILKSDLIYFGFLKLSANKPNYESGLINQRGFPWWGRFC